MSGEKHTAKKYGDSNGPSYYEIMPRELIDMCLDCKRERCTGNCRRYEEKEREVNFGGRVDNEGNRLPSRGSAAKKHYFRGGYVTDRQMAEMLNVGITTIRKARAKGMEMEEIYRYYEQKYRLKGDRDHK